MVGKPLPQAWGLFRALPLLPGGLQFPHLSKKTLVAMILRPLPAPS